MNAEQRVRARQADADQEDHYVKVAEGEWGIWKWVGLRAAGFPVAGVERLSAGRAAEAAELVIKAEDEAEKLWQNALEELSRNIDEADKQAWPVLMKVLRELKKGKVPKPVDVEYSAEAAIKQFAAACKQVEAAYSNFDRLFEEALSNTSRALKEIVGTERFREAIIWQNRFAFQTGIKELLEGGDSGEPSKNHRQRRNEELVASYWQRYCAKNDTIGFFGPVGWARLAPQSDAVSVKPGRDLLASRTAYFDSWCIDALAEAAAADEQVRYWLAPRRNPNLYIEGATLRLPLTDPIQLSKQEASVLAACDGKRGCLRIARELLAGPESGFENEAQVIEVIEELAKRGLISRIPAIPSGMWPERGLRNALNNIEDEGVRHHAFGPLEAMEAAREKVARASGDAQRLHAALEELETTFTSLTGVDSTRASGKMYAGRTLVYEECRRNAEVELGSKIIEALGPPLSLILTSGRWFTLNVGNIYRELFDDIYEKLAHASGSKAVSATDFWARTQAEFYGSRAYDVKDLRASLVARWSEILSLPEGVRSAKFSSEILKPRVQAAFQAPRPGWKSARYHSPDFMISARSLDAIREGDYELVLGEIHIAANTLNYALFVENHPSPGDLLRAVEADLPEPLIIPIPPKHYPGRTSRTQNALITHKDICLEFSMDSPTVPDITALPLGDFVILPGEDGLVLKDRSGQYQSDLMDAFAEALMSVVIDSFKILAPGAHKPRVMIDRLVISREQWEFKAEEMEFAFEKQESQRFLAARRWAASLGLPRLLFYKSPVEVKPCYLDLDSPIYVNLFSRIIRKTAAGQKQTITLSEMLPTPSDVWLEDAAGNRYTSELRIVAVDLTGRGE